MSKTKSILQLNCIEARNFFLEEKSYCDFELPPYIKFEPLLKAIDKMLENNENLNDFKAICGNKPKNLDNVNYKLFNNKNGKYDWRPFELINPIIYVYLVREITRKENWEFIQNSFKKLQKNSYVACHSIPIKSQTKKSNKAEQILEWWDKMEQESMKYSLEFNYMFETDITNFYPSIYTHSIVWALHTKENAKKRSGDLLGDKIDKYIRDMRYGQTNGIPQGCTLTHLIAEMLLAYIDNLLIEKLRYFKIKDFKIIRYRDDYKIFVNSPQIADFILKNLSEILADNGLKLNPNKTTNSQNIIQNSIKKDKVQWFFIEANLKAQKSLQKQLIVFHKFALDNQNSGTLIKILQAFLSDLHKSQSKNTKNKLFKTNLDKENVEVLIAILVDIVSFNPKIYPIAMSVLGILLDKVDKKFATKTIQKLLQINNNAYMQIWLQRAIIKLENVSYDELDEKICQEVLRIKALNDNEKYEVNLWNMQWLECKKLANLFRKYPVIDKIELDELEKYTQEKEVNSFIY